MNKVTLVELLVLLGYTTVLELYDLNSIYPSVPGGFWVLMPNIAPRNYYSV